MKKLLTIISAVSVALLVSCGPSAEEQQRIEQARLDSIAQATEQAMQDSLNAVMEQARLDSVAAAQDAINKAMQDSLAALQSQVKNINKPAKPKKQDEKPKTAQPGQGRG